MFEELQRKAERQRVAVIADLMDMSRRHEFEEMLSFTSNISYVSNCREKMKITNFVIA